MSRVAALIQDMVAAGVSAELIGRTAALLAEREAVPVLVTDEQAERRRAKDRERKRLRNSADSAEVTDDGPPKKETSPTPPKEKTTPLSSEPAVLRCKSGRERFAELWEAYPRRSGSNSRKNAESRFLSALRAGVTADTMIDGARRYAAHCDAAGITGTAFVKMTEAWINGQLWTSDYTPTHGPPPRQAKRNTALDGLDELERRFRTDGQPPHLRIAG